jgi:hypothetical protein
MSMVALRYVDIRHKGIWDMQVKAQVTLADDLKMY